MWLSQKLQTPLFCMFPLKRNREGDASAVAEQTKTRVEISDKRATADAEEAFNHTLFNLFEWEVKCLRLTLKDLF